MSETSTEQAEREQADAARAEKERQDQIDKDMDADEFVVTAPFIGPKVKDRSGAFVIKNFNEGAVILGDEIDPDSLRHHLDGRQMAVKGSDAAKFAGPAGTPKPGEPPNVPVTEQPVLSLPLEERLSRQQAAAADTGKPKPGPRTAKSDG